MNETKSEGSTPELNEHLEIRLKPLEEAGIVHKVQDSKSPKWATAANIGKLAAIVSFSDDSKGEPDSVMVNGKKVLLTLPMLLPYFVMLNEDNPEANQKLEKLFEKKKKKLTGEGFSSMKLY